MASPGGASGTLWAGNVRLRPLRAGTGPGSGQRERRLLFSPGSRTAGPGGAEAPFRPAGGARRLRPAPREQRCRPPDPSAARRRCENNEAQRGRPPSRRRAREGRGAGDPARPRLDGPAGRARNVIGGRRRGAGLGEAGVARDAGIGVPRGWARLLGGGRAEGKRGPPGRQGRSRSGKLGLAGQGRGHEQKKRNNEDKRRYTHYGWNSPPVSS